jgi:DNA-binding NarL/FixJ family response regulator
MNASPEAERPLQALIIDDDPVSRVAQRVVLSRLGVTITGEAPQGHSGLQMARSFDPDLVCLDLGLPDIDGIDLLGVLRELRPHAKVVVVTSSTGSEHVRAALTGGADGYMYKPVAHSTTRSLLQRLFPEHGFGAA